MKQQPTENQEENGVGCKMSEKDLRYTMCDNNSLPCHCAFCSRVIPLQHARVILHGLHFCNDNHAKQWQDEIGIWAINDCEWVAARSLEDAVREYKRSGDDSYQEEWEPERLSEQELLETHYHDPDLNTTISFQEQLVRLRTAGKRFPCYFATTEW